MMRLQRMGRSLSADRMRSVSAHEMIARRRIQSKSKKALRHVEPIARSRTQALCRNQISRPLVGSSMERSSSREILASVAVDDTDPRDPTANCDRCGARGTVARAVRHTDPRLVLRYCSNCWPGAHDELDKLIAGEDEAAWSSNSRSWFDVRSFLALIAVPTKGGRPATPEILAAIAPDIRAMAPEMDGPMPPDVEAFLSSHGPSAA